MRIGVITFPGSLDDRDAQRAIRHAGGEPVALWHGDHDLYGVDAIVLPGGFSYGDYLRCGAIASRSPIMSEVIDAANVNPNGSVNDIAGVSNARGNVVGLMPHPEHATEEGFGPDTPAAMRNGTDGLAVFASVIEAALVR